MILKYLMMILCVFNIKPGQRCILNSRRDFGQPLPVIIRNGRLLEPTDKYGNVEIDNGETLTLSCGESIVRHPNANKHFEVATVTCQGGDTFTNNDWITAPSSFLFFSCDIPPVYKSKRTNRTCHNNNKIFEVGYPVRDDFYPIYETCFDEWRLTPLYSVYTQKPYNAQFQQHVERPYFVEDDAYRHLSVFKLFSPRGLEAAVRKRVGGHAANDYITAESFLSRGHLAAKTDFVYAFGERASFHYVNCAPQWYGFNSGNWNTLEVDLRNRVHAAGYDTVMYTGTYGVMELLNSSGSTVDVHLYDDVNNNPLIPVPLYFYKVVYEPSSKRGTAFVGINNPFYSSVSRESVMIFCPDQCANNTQFSWLTWSPRTKSEGICFCCTVEHFRQVIPHLPPFEVTGLLS